MTEVSREHPALWLLPFSWAGPPRVTHLPAHGEATSSSDVSMFLLSLFLVSPLTHKEICS